MRTLVLASLTALVALPAPARAQHANRTISLESGLSAPVGAAGERTASLAAGASWWLEGGVHGTAAVSWTAARETGGRGVGGAAGFAWAPGTARLRPRLRAELGWERTWRPDGTLAGALVVAAGAGLEGFLRRDLALTLDAGMRRSHGMSLDVRAGVRFGF